MGSVKTVEIDGMSVKLPVVLTAESSCFPVFEKPAWTADEDAVVCMKCSERFTHFRRKHHCRSCGKIFCGYCCFERIHLPHFGFPDAERVCCDCKTVSLLIVKAVSDNPVIECGGLHILMSVVSEKDVFVMGSVSIALHSLAQQTTLNVLLTEMGALKVLKSILTAGSDYPHLLDQSLGALSLLCKDMKIANQAIKAKTVESLIPILSMSGTHAALAAHVLLLLLSNLDAHDIILQSHPQIMSAVFNALQKEDFQIQGAVTMMLVYLSAGSNTCRQMVLSEDEARGFPLVHLLKSSTHGVLLHTACIVANLATTVPQEDISYGHRYVNAFCDLLSVISEEHIDIIAHIGRGLANFAESKKNYLSLLPHLPAVVSSLLKSKHEVHKLHACRLFVSLMSAEPTSTINVVLSSGAEDLLTTIFQLTGLPEFLTMSLLRKVSRLSVCS